jgi:LysR family transcriptional activator of dmlA
MKSKLSCAQVNDPTMSIQIAELPFFVTLAASTSLSAAARDLGVSTAAVSRRLARMEAAIGVVLVTRSTRRMSLTPEGATLLAHARRIVDDLARLDDTLAHGRIGPQGLLRINATLGFGRIHVAPIVARFVTAYPDVDVQLQLSAQPPPVTSDAFDVCIRFGNPPDLRVVAKRLAPNRRLLCASPAYLAAHPPPASPHDLAHHDCIDIRQGNAAYGVWRLGTSKGGRRVWTSIRIHGAMTTNDGDVAVQWALAGLGIVMRAEWDVRRHLASGRLVHVMPHVVTPNADIHAVYAERHKQTLRVRAFADFIAAAFKATPAG